MLFVEDCDCRYNQAMEYLYNDMGLAVIRGEEEDSCGKVKLYVLIIINFSKVQVNINVIFRNIKCICSKRL